MPGKSFSVAVNPAVLRWARESAGFTLNEVGEKTGKSAQLLAAWESGARRPKWTVLSRLAEIYKRPVTALLLPAPPEENPPPADFRTLPDAKGAFSPSTRFAIRTARWLVARANELQEQLETGADFRSPPFGASDDPEQVAGEFRARLNVSIEDQIAWRDSWQALKGWRGAVEAQHVFVFQFNMPVEEARGFSLFEARQPAIVLNQADAVAARIFTLFHECAHILIAQPGICKPKEDLSNHSPRIETFCNRFAAALLLPRDDFRNNIPSVLDDDSFRMLGQRYQVSRYVVLGRLQGMGAISSRQYHQISHRWQSRETVKSRKATKGGPSAVKRCLSQKGEPFVSLVVRAAKRRLITHNEAMIYLGTNLNVFRQLAKGA